MKVVHIITGLETGGAEMMLLKLIRELQPDGVSNAVVSLTGVGPVGAKARALGIPVEAVGLRRHPLSLAKLPTLARHIRRMEPDVVQTWMYHADLIGGVAARIVGVPVVWGIRHSNLDPSVNKRATLLAARGCAAMSGHVPERIVSCSMTAKQVHEAFGYRGNKMRVIPNGFDLDHFAPDPALRGGVRRDCGIPDAAPVVGAVGRFNPQKDHRTLLRAAGQVQRWNSGVHFVLCGDGLNESNNRLRDLIAQLPRPQQVHLLGRRDDVPRVVSAFDVFVSSSIGEGFPNAVGEAMAMAIPCAVTDVGDSAYLVGETGRVVPPGKAGALAGAMTELLSVSETERRRLGAAARERIRTNFSIDVIARQYRELYEEVIACAGSTV